MMINKKLTLTLLVFATIILGLHYIINAYLLNYSLSIKLVLKINFFVTLLTFLVINTLEMIRNKFPDKVGFGYLAFVLIKMIISVIFLFPFLKEKPSNIKVIILSFFIIFFAHLFFEVYLIIRSLKNDENH